jgi:hypothetical protein
MVLARHSGLLSGLSFVAISTRRDPSATKTARIATRLCIAARCRVQPAARTGLYTGCVCLRGTCTGSSDHSADGAAERLTASACWTRRALRPCSWRRTCHCGAPAPAVMAQLVLQHRVRLFPWFLSFEHKVRQFSLVPLVLESNPKLQGVWWSSHHHHAVPSEQQRRSHYGINQHYL